MAAWTAQVNTVTPKGQNIVIGVTYFLASDTGLTEPLGTDTVIVPNTISLQNAQKQIVAQASDFRSGYNLTATYQGQTINVP